MKILVGKPGISLKKEVPAVFIGQWAVQTKGGGWSDYPIDVYWFSDTKKLLGCFYEVDLTVRDIRVANVANSFVERYLPCLVEDDIVYVSKYRHDFVKTPSGLYIDGGRDYIRSNALIQNQITFDIEIGKFKLGDIEIEYDYN